MAIDKERVKLVQQYADELSQAKISKAQSEGRLEAATKELKTKFGVSSVKAAKELLERKKNQMIKLNEEIDNELEELQNQYPLEA